MTLLVILSLMTEAEGVGIATAIFQSLSTKDPSTYAIAETAEASIDITLVVGSLVDRSKQSKGIGSAVGKV